jgi:chromosomal replication initiator protein
VPNQLFKDWLAKHYSMVLSEALTEVHAPDTSLVFLPEGTQVAAGAPVVMVEVERQIPPHRRRGPRRVGSLNERYTFDTFIVGPSNQFAHAACRAVAEAPSRSYNPLFIYGGVGLGKTHLMHAIGRYVLQHDPESQAHLHLVRAFHERDDQRHPLRAHSRLPRRLPQRRYPSGRRHQFLAGKESTQTEFFHTFNALYDAQKQIVLSSDRPPHDIPQLEERLPIAVSNGV